MQGTGAAAKHRKGPVATRSAVAFRGFRILARFELGQPSIGFFGCDVQTRSLIAAPSCERALSELLALLLTIHVLLDRFSHQVMRLAVAQGCPLDGGCNEL